MESRSCYAPGGSTPVKVCCQETPPGEQLSAESGINDNKNVDHLPSTDGSEHTIAGHLLGSVRNHISGKPDNQQDQAARARSNDTIAEIGADTFAMIPGVRLLAAGGIRAGLLVDPTDNLAGNALGFGKNFAEGAALHGISKLSGRLMTSESGSLAKAAGFFGAGFGMGAVKSGFNEHSWQDASGNMSIVGGLSHMAKEGAVGGAIGVSAGFLGMGAAKLGLSMRPKIDISPRLAGAGAGMLSGYSAGAVFGGIDAARQGGNAREIFSGANQGGLVGSLAGGFTGAAMRHSPVSAIEQVCSRPGDGNQRIAAPLYFDKAGSSTSNVRLGDYSLQNRLFDVLRPEYRGLAASKEWPFASDAEYLNTAVDKVSQKARVYQQGQTELVIPDSYARKLEASGKQNVEGSGKNSAEYGQRANLQDMAEQLRLLPDPTLVKSLTLRDDFSPGDPLYNHKVFESPNSAAGEASKAGDLTFYKLDKSQAIDGTLVPHEWSHLLKDQNPKESAAFDRAAELEKNGYHVTPYARSKNNYHEENWAEHMASLIHPDSGPFLETVSSAHIRASLLGKTLAKALSNVPIEQRSPYHEMYGARVRYINEDVLPVARRELVDILKTGELDDRVKALKVLVALHRGNESALYRTLNKEQGTDYRRLLQLEMNQTAGTDRDKATAARVLMTRLPDVEGKQLAWQQTMKFAGSDKELKTDLALATFQTCPEMRPQALEVLLNEGQPRALNVLEALAGNHDVELAARAQARIEQIRAEQGRTH